MSISPQPDFVEEAYLLANPDVAAAVARGSVSSGKAHYDVFGHKEGRPLSPNSSSEKNPLHRLWLDSHPRHRLAIVGNVEFATTVAALAKMIKYGRWEVVPPDQAEAVILYDLKADMSLDGAINGGGFSSAKQTVAEHFEAVFGRSLSVDPLTYRGDMVVKSNTGNGLHDGRIVPGPTQIEPDFVAQRVIRNDIGEMVQDMRVPFIGGIVPFVYFKYRPLDSRFSNTNSTVVLDSTHTAFNNNELDLIARFADAISLDYGEMDILRDRESGEIFIVDVNNTPVGPPNGLPAAESSVAIRLMTGAFEAAFFKN